MPCNRCVLSLCVDQAVWKISRISLTPCESALPACPHCLGQEPHSHWLAEGGHWADKRAVLAAPAVHHCTLLLCMKTEGEEDPTTTVPDNVSTPTANHLLPPTIYPPTALILLWFFRTAGLYWAAEYMHTGGCMYSILVRVLVQDQVLPVYI